MDKRVYLGLKASWEKIITYRVVTEYGSCSEPYYCFANEDVPEEHLDMYQCIENALHEILDNGGDEEDVCNFLGLEINDDERFTPVDLGYVIPGYVGYVKDAPIDEIEDMLGGIVPFYVLEFEKTVFEDDPIYGPEEENTEGTKKFATRKLARMQANADFLEALKQALDANPSAKDLRFSVSERESFLKYRIWQKPLGVNNGWTASWTVKEGD